MARALAFASMIGGLAACDRGPTTFTSAEGQFSVLLPRAPQLIGPFPSENGSASRTVAAEGDSALYSVIYTDYPQAPADPARFLLDQRDAQLKQAPGKVVLERPLDMHGVPGLEYRVEFANGTVGHSRMFMRGSRLYHQSVFGYPDLVFTDRFLESFTLR